MKIAVLGLGLMGGSFAYALRGFRNCLIIGYDQNPEVMTGALTAGAIDEKATTASEAVTGCDLALFCTAPEAVLENMRLCAGAWREGAVVAEICGVKQELTPAVEALLPPCVEYIGIHPMAGKEEGGFANAAPDLFQKAGFIIITREAGPLGDSPGLELVRGLCRYVGAGRIELNTAADHDRIIGYTSDLMHIAATALCHDFPEDMTMAHTAGAFRDCTRIADIDADLWTELLRKNAGYTLPHLAAYIENLSALRDALAGDDEEFVREFLQTAHDNKLKMLKL